MCKKVEVVAILGFRSQPLNGPSHRSGGARPGGIKGELSRRWWGSGLRGTAAMLDAEVRKRVSERCLTSRNLRTITKPRPLQANSRVHVWVRRHLTFSIARKPHTQPATMLGQDHH